MMLDSAVRGFLLCLYCCLKLTKRGAMAEGVRMRTSLLKGESADGLMASLSRTRWPPVGSHSRPSAGSKPGWGEPGVNTSTGHPPHTHTAQPPPLDDIKWKQKKHDRMLSLIATLKTHLEKSNTKLQAQQSNTDFNSNCMITLCFTLCLTLKETKLKSPGMAYVMSLLSVWMY